MMPNSAPELLDPASIKETKFEQFGALTVGDKNFVRIRYVRHENEILIGVLCGKWKQYAQSKSWPMSWIYRRESELLLGYEKQIAKEFDKSTFVSVKEAALFKTLSPEASDKVDYFNNGVDIEYFSPTHPFSSPYSAGSRVLVFTGAMDYWANVDAVEWFAHAVFPSVRARIPDVEFYIVGSNPSTRVTVLAKQPGITVTGSVEDIRPYLKHASIAIAPLRIARGIQNKVLEAMAMEKIVVVSPQAMEGIQAMDGKELYVADDEQSFIRQTIALLSSSNDVAANAARARIVSDYTWTANLARFNQLLISEQ